MRILQISPEFPPYSLGGGGVLVENLCQGLQQQGHQVAVLAGCYAVGTLFDQPFSASIEGSTVVWLPLIPTPKVRFQLKTILPPNPTSFAHLIKVLSNGDFDIVHIHGFGHFVCDCVAALCWVTRRDYVLTIHGFPKEPERRKGILKLIYDAYARILGAQLIRRAYKTVAVSNSVAHECLRYVRPEKVEVIQNAVDINIFSTPPSELIHEVMSRYGLRGKMMILCIGRLSVAKGFQYAIRALPLVRAEIPNAHLIIIGKDNGYGYLRHLKMLVREEGVERHVTFAGSVSENTKRTLLWLARVVAIPSIEEPFGIVAIEALASGRPIVGSKVGGLQEVLSNDDFSLLVSKGNTKELAEALIKTMSDKRTNIEARRNRASRSAQFSLSRMVSEYIELYQKYMQ